MHKTLLNIYGYSVVVFSPFYYFMLIFCYFFLLDWFWRCDCRTRRGAQFRWHLEGQLHYLHCDKVLVLPFAVCALWHPNGTYLGHLLRHRFFPAHLGSCTVYQEFPDWDSMHQPCLFHLRPHLLWPTLWGFWQNIQQYPHQHAERNINNFLRIEVYLILFLLLIFLVPISRFKLLV